MKHLRKFNENITESYLTDLLKDIFAELIDDYSIQVKIYKDTRRICVDIKPSFYEGNKNLPVIRIGSDFLGATKMETEKIIDRYEKYLELIKDIEVCYKRAVDELPDVKSELMVTVDNRIYIKFYLPVDDLK